MSSSKNQTSESVSTLPATLMAQVRNLQNQAVGLEDDAARRSAFAQAVRLAVRAGEPSEANALLHDDNLAATRDALGLRAMLALLSGDHEHAQTLATTASNQSDIGITALADLLEVHVFSGNVTAAIEVGQRCRARIAEGDVPHQLRCTWLFARLRLERQDWSGALVAGRRLLQAAKRAGMAWFVAAGHTVMAEALVALRDYRKAKTIHTSALQHYRALGSRPGVVESLGGIALCHLGLGSTADALQHLNRAITQCEEMRAVRTEAKWRVHHDHCLVLLQRTEWRIESLGRFIAVVDKLNDPAWKASLYCQLGLSYRDILDHERALTAHQASLQISESRDDAYATSIDLANIAHELAALGRPQQAQRNLQRAISLCPDTAMEHKRQLAAQHDALKPAP